MNLRKAIIAAALLCPASLLAQNPEYSLVLESNPQLTASAAALSDFAKKSMSQVEASFAKDNGGFVGIDGSSDCWQGKLGAESYTRISDRMVFFGRLSYSYFKGNDMGGSVLRDLYYNPVAFLDYTGNNGVKTRELYSLGGGMSYALGRRWSLGLGMDYESGNNVKTKDPRYRSEWMYMNYDLSVWFRPSSGFAVGASLIYRNTQERVMSHLFGLSDKQQFLGIDRGAFYGTRESVEGTYGFVSPTDFQPMNNNFFGASLQTRAGVYHGNVEVLYRSGKYGFDTSTMPKYFEYSGIEASYDGAILLGGAGSLHDIHFGAGLRTLGNTEYSFKYSTAAGQNTVVDYTGSKHVMDRREITANLGYKGSIGISEGKPSLQFGADADMHMRNQRTTIFPFYRDHVKTSFTAGAFIDKYIYGRHGMLAIGASVSGGAGFGTAAEDGTLANSSGSKVISFDEYKDRQFEFETAPYAGAGLHITYSRNIRKGMDAYVSLRDDFSSLLAAPEFLDGRFRNAALLSIGLSL